MEVSVHFCQPATTHWPASPAKQAEEQDAKGVQKMEIRLEGATQKPVGTWLRPTHFFKAALQVPFPPIFNQSTSSSSQLRQQASPPQPRCSGPSCSCCRDISAAPAHPQPPTNTLAQVLRPCKWAARHRDRLTPGGLSQVLQQRCPAHLFPDAGCLWASNRKQSTATTSLGHSKKRRLSRSVTSVYCIKANC